METVANPRLDECPRGMQALELALLRRGVEHRDATRQRCGGCHRTPLIGERIYLSEEGSVLCALCCSEQAELRLQSRVVRGSGRERAIRILDQQAA